MIIKFKAGEGWQMYDDVDSLRYYRLDAFLPDIELENGFIDFTDTISTDGPVDSNGYPNRVLLEFMNSKQTKESQIIAHSPIYLMNNQGRTIETI